MPKYTKEGLDKALESVEKAIKLHDDLIRCYYKLKLSLQRESRKLDPVFWLDKVTDPKIKQALFREYKEDYFIAYGRNYPENGWGIHAFIDWKQTERIKWDQDRRKLKEAAKDAEQSSTP